MNGLRQGLRQSLWMGFGAAALLVAGCASGGSMSGATPVTLSGSQEVPPVTTAASGSGTITVAADMAISGSVTTTGINGTAAHIHMGAMGTNGPVIVPLVKAGDGVWAVGTGAKLSDAQYAAFKAGNTYVNVHSEANKGGEIRGQLKP
jgi:CHRD domain